MHKAIGIDIGGTNYRIGIVDEEGKCLSFEKKSSSIFHSKKKGCTEILIDQIRDYLEKHLDMQKDIVTIGIGFPAAVSSRKGIVYSCPNVTNEVESFDNQNVARRLTTALKIPTVINKDTNNLLRYDLTVQSLEGTTIAFYFGTGIGNSVFLDGHFLEGKHGVATDVGHIPVYLSDQYCTCGNRGCIECYGSGRVLRQLWEDNFSKNGEEFTDLFIAHKGSEFVDHFIEALAVPVASELNIFDPDNLVLGGGVINMKGFPVELFYDKVYEFTRKPLPGRDYHILSAGTAPEAGVIGSALNAFTRLGSD